MTDFYTTRADIKKQLIAIANEIAALKVPQEQAYFRPIYLDIAKHLANMRREELVEEQRKFQQFQAQFGFPQGPQMPQGPQAPQGRMKA